MGIDWESWSKELAETQRKMSKEVGHGDAENQEPTKSYPILKPLEDHPLLLAAPLTKEDKYRRFL